ncbi:RNA-DNA hybrid ribonuclease [Perkinsus olseni]|uniref:RNA-DNA hybrid ribonuclease n=2 Tax=Perkinsus olseni TaxID=32597 RepID=A0A7J6P174_PEROL|nr:RNA-DNA hybrid ribonuclease [Perkinsus olseni]KAF4734927.1 RNA-DNA hybrid ribonuclease [Perkinsus olseni]
MGPKKKAAPKKGGGGEDEVDLFEEFVKKLRKLQKDYEVPKLAQLEGIMNTIVEEGEELPAWNFNGPQDIMAFRIACEALRQSNYNKFKALRLWKCEMGDEGVRSVCNYLEMPTSPQFGGCLVEDLQITDGGVTSLGCAILGRTLSLNGYKLISLLRLDHNKFGNAGLEALAEGLCQNGSLRGLSLQYCGIGPEGAQHLSLILIYVHCIIEDLNLRGNHLEAEGLVELLSRGARGAKKLKVINVADNKIHEKEEVLRELTKAFRGCLTIERYNLSGNFFTDVGAQRVVQGLIGLSHVKEVLLTERCSPTTLEALEQALGASKGKKGGKGKKKKK